MIFFVSLLFITITLFVSLLIIINHYYYFIFITAITDWLMFICIIANTD